jgi:hypothetical protein
MLFGERDSSTFCCRQQGECCCQGAELVKNKACYNMLKEESRCFVPGTAKKKESYMRRGCATGVRLAVGVVSLAVAATYIVNAVVIPGMLSLECCIQTL